MNVMIFTCGQQISQHIRELERIAGDSSRA